MTIFATKKKSKQNKTLGDPACKSNAAGKPGGPGPDELRDEGKLGVKRLKCLDHRVKNEDSSKRRLESTTVLDLGPEPLTKKS